MSISEKVLKTIEDKNIHPLARWKFVAKNTTLWFTGFIAIVVGTLGMSTLLHILNDNDWDIYQYFGRTFVEHIVTVFPYFWLLILLIFIAIAYAIFRHTKTGYRHTTFVFLATIFSVSILLGVILFVFGAGESIDTFFLENIGGYAELPHNKTVIWNKPELGLLSGTITKLINDNKFMLTDFSNREWVVIENDTAWKENSFRTIGGKIKLLGSYENDGVFITTEIRPWTASPSHKTK